jgi:hypothetical protein
MKTILQSLLMALLLMAITACSSLSAKNRASIQNVAVSRDVEMHTDRPDIGSTAKGIASTAGILTAGIASAASAGGENALKAKLAAAGIDIRQIASAGVEAGLRSSGYLPMRAGAATHTMKIEITSYGLHNCGFLGGRLPKVWFNLRLMDAANRQVWFSQGFGIAELSTRSSEEYYLADLNRLRTGWEDAVRRAMPGAIKSLAPR